MEPAISTAAHGVCTATQNSAATALKLACEHSATDAPVATVYDGAPGTNGAAIFVLGDATSPMEANLTGLTTQQVGALRSGQWYITVATAGNPTGELRGQLARPTQVRHGFDGSQFIPSQPGPADAHCIHSLAFGRSVLESNCTTDFSYDWINSWRAKQGTSFQMFAPSVWYMGSGRWVVGQHRLSAQDKADLAAGILYVTMYSEDGPDTPQGWLRGRAAGFIPAM